MASASQVQESSEKNAPPESLTGAARELSALKASTAGRATARRPNRRGQVMREKLVQAAAECFREYGYSKTRISDIVHRAGTAQGNFYRHFSSLDEIFVAALEPPLRELASSSGRRLPASSWKSVRPIRPWSCKCFSHRSVLSTKSARVRSQSLLKPSFPLTAAASRITLSRWRLRE